MAASNGRPAGETAGAADFVNAGCESETHSTPAVATQFVATKVTDPDAHPLALDKKGAAPSTLASDFIQSMFGPVTEHPIYICSFPNIKDDPEQPGERHVLTRTAAHIDRFVTKWDQPGRGLFFCTGTVKAKTKRAKENIVETICLHADIDLKDIDGDTSRGYIVRRLNELRYRPSVIIFSGRGYHCYWLFKEAIDAQTEMDRIELALQQLADLIAGDLAVAEISRVLRMPGSHNSKDGKWTEVEIIQCEPTLRYELDDLEEMLAETSPIFLRKRRERAITAGESNVFTEYAKAHGFNPPIDIDARLKAMEYMGGSDGAVHQTQLQCSASMLSSGMGIEEVVAILLATTRAAAGEYAARWNWKREERTIRGMCETWLKKHPTPTSTVTVTDTEQDDGEAKPVALPPPRDEPSLKALRSLNEKYFVTKEGGKTWVIAFERQHGRQIVTFMRFGDFANLYMNRLVKIETEKSTKFEPLGSWWLRHSQRRQYEGLVFAPGNPAKVIDGHFNLWRGWGVEPKRGSWKLMRRHIWLVLVAKDKCRFKYIMRWLAWMVQYPAERAEVALVFKGKRGTGKGTLGNCMMVLFGQHSHQVSNPKHLTGNFNAHMRDTCFLFGDECYFPGDKTAEGAFKRLITEPTLLIEGKRRDAITMPNYLHVMLASNEKWIVPAGENERRWYMCEVSDCRMQNKDYFKTLNDQLRDGGYSAMLHDLMSYKLGDWHPRDLLNANGLMEQQRLSLSPLDTWWVELLETGTLTGTNPKGQANAAVSNEFLFTIVTSQGTQSNSPFDVILTKREVKRPGLYDQARRIEPRLRYHTSDHQLGAYLRDHGCDNTKKVMRHQGWTFPTLQEARKAWKDRYPGWSWRDPSLKDWRHEEQDDDADPDDPERPLDADETRTREPRS